MALLAAMLLALVSCSSAPKVEKTTTTTYREGVPGGILIESYKLTAMVASINPATRQVTLVAPDGSRNTFTAGPQNRSLDQLQVGHHVRVLVTRRLVVLLGKDRALLEQGPILAPALTANDDKEGVMKSDTFQRTARIKSVDRKRREATLEFPDAATKTFPIREDVDPRRIKRGEEVLIQTSSAVVLTPQNQ